MIAFLATLFLSTGAGSARSIAERAPGDTTRCVAAADFLRRTQQMIVVLEADTVDDWRTKERLPGCRATAAGSTRLGVAAEAVRFYERLRASGWARTPDPRDAPNEASLRFRHQVTDCLFNVYEVPRLFTDAEFAVNDSVRLAPGEARYQVLVQCVAALPAAPR
ncbi:MAG: hypothetical protein U0164_02670 [Gemmatimonadaceae bacterium]